MAKEKQERPRRTGLGERGIIPKARRRGPSPHGSPAGCSKFQQRKSLFFHLGRPAVEEARKYAQAAQRDLCMGNPMAAWELIGLCIDRLAEAEDLANGIYRNPEAMKKQGLP